MSNLAMRNPHVTDWGAAQGPRERIAAENKSGIRPIGGYVVIELPEAEEKTAGGIILPQDQAEKEKYGTTQGTIVAAADDVKYGLAPGQTVAFARYAGTTIRGSDRKDYRLLLDEDVKGIFEIPA